MKGEPTLAIHGGKPVIDPERARFRWPIITQEIERRVIEQLHTTISIYDKSGIIADFENAFSSYHGRQYALLSNSGTSAIFSMFEGIGIGPGDDVLCPVYTFHATVSPLVYLGANPIFCDCDESGNVTLEEIRKRITPRTKAVIITHMWGTPVEDIRQIAEFCNGRGIYLLEDCSHAHGAEIAGQRVGTFGHAAAWSLQGQKIISGGEGGILLTDDRQIYERALLQGHYNKRPLKEISIDNPLRRFYLTGFGLKLRAHPLAIAIAAEQFEQIERFIAVKNTHAGIFNDALDGYNFLSVPQSASGMRRSWYAYILKYDQRNADVNREAFVRALHAEGLVEADIPGSTMPLDCLPLFTEPSEAMPRLYKPTSRMEQTPQKSKAFPRAGKFYDSIVKFPVWAREEDRGVVVAYAEGIRKVADYIHRHGELEGAQ